MSRIVFHIFQLLFFFVSWTPLWHLAYWLFWRNNENVGHLGNDVDLVFETTGAAASQSLSALLQSNDIRVAGHSHHAWPMLWGRLRGKPILFTYREYAQWKRSMADRYPAYNPWGLRFIKYWSLRFWVWLLRVPTYSFDDVIENPHKIVQDVLGNRIAGSLPHIRTTDIASDESNEL